MKWDKARRGDIFYIAGTEAVGSEQAGDRPAVIVSNDVGNRYAPIVEVVYLTTRQKARMPTHVPIYSTERPSTALCEQIVTVSKHRLQRYIGSASDGEMRGIDKALHISLGINTKEGNAMKITMITPFGEMNFDMPPAKATDLMQRAFQYAAEKETVKEKTEIIVPQLKAGFPPAAEPTTVTEVATDGPEMVARPEPPKKQSRVERMFGNFRMRDPGASYETVVSDGRIHVTPPPREPEEYRGFLLIKCPACGKLHGFCAKNPTSAYRCSCGETTELHGLLPAHLKCKCGSEFTYKTNVADTTFDYPCLNCGSPVDLELNRRGTAYVTIGGRNE